MLKHLEGGPDTPERQKLQERANKTLTKLNLTHLDLDEYESKLKVFLIRDIHLLIAALMLILLWSRCSWRT